MFQYCSKIIGTGCFLLKKFWCVSIIAPRLLELVVFLFKRFRCVTIIAPRLWELVVFFMKEILLYFNNFIDIRKTGLFLIQEI